MRFSFSQYCTSTQVHAGLRGAIAYVLISMLNIDENEQEQNQMAFFETSERPTMFTISLIGNLTANDTSGKHVVMLIDAKTYQLLQSTTLYFILFTVFLMVRIKSTPMSISTQT